jgi:hypothetical protein
MLRFPIKRTRPFYKLLLMGPLEIGFFIISWEIKRGNTMSSMDEETGETIFLSLRYSVESRYNKRLPLEIGFFIFSCDIYYTVAWFLP